MFRQSASRLLRQLQDSIAEARDVASGLAGQLALGFVPSATIEILPPILREFRSAFPGVRLVLHELNPEQQVRGLREGSLGCGCFDLPPDQAAPFGDRSLSAVPVSREPLVAALPADHPLSAQRRVGVRELAGEPFVMVSSHRGSGLRDIILEQCRRGDMLPNVVQEATLIQTIAGLVASGVGVALLPASVRRLQRSGVAYRLTCGGAAVGGDGHRLDAGEPEPGGRRVRRCRPQRQTGAVRRRGVNQPGHAAGGSPAQAACSSRVSPSAVTGTGFA